MRKRLPGATWLRVTTLPPLAMCSLRQHLLNVETATGLKPGAVFPSTGVYRSISGGICG